MMGDRFERSYIQKVYLMNNKEFERTLDMFLTDNLPEVDAKPQLTIIETAPNQSNMINTGSSNANFGQGSSVNQVDMRSYVLDQYKEALCPRKLNKYELAHNEAMERQKLREKEEQKEVRKKILALAEMMQYDDDIEESNVTLNKQDYQRDKPASPKQEANCPTQINNNNQPEEEKKEETLDDIMGSDDEDDFMMDDPMAFIERQDSSQADV